MLDKLKPSYEVLEVGEDERGYCLESLLSEQEARLEATLVKYESLQERAQLGTLGSEPYEKLLTEARERAQEALVGVQVLTRAYREWNYGR